MGGIEVHLLEQTRQEEKENTDAPTEKHGLEIRRNIATSGLGQKVDFGKKTGLEKHIGTQTIGYKKGRRWIDLRAAGAPWCELRRPNRAYHIHFAA
jgi:hypothetical protein